MMRILLISFVFTFSIEFSTAAQSPIQNFQNLNILDNSSLERTIYSNREMGLSPFHAISVLYSISISSVKVPAQSATQFITALKNTKGVLDCFFDSRYFMLYVTVEKENNYVRIEKIKEVMQEYTNLQIEKYSEELFTNK